MNSLLYYLLQVIVASGILYAYYHFVLRNKKFHRYNRFYLLSATIISITIPFLNIPVYFTNQETHSSVVLQTLTVFSPSYFSDTTATSIIIASVKSNWFTWENIIYSFYILVAAIAFIRIILSIKKIKTIIRKNPAEKLEHIRFVNTDEPGTPFSFFRWLFWNRKIELQSEKGEQVFRHELFHIEQKHSVDVMFMEFLTMIFWINPFFHLIKREVRAIHEFLADEFAIHENKKWEYAELLLMQAMNTKVNLSNPFFHNQIKRRIAMITSSSKPGHQYLRKVLVLPIAAIVLALFAFKYKEKVNEAEKLKDENTASQKINIPENPKLSDRSPVAIVSMAKKTTVAQFIKSWKKYSVRSITKRRTLTDTVPTSPLHYYDSSLHYNDALLVIDGVTIGSLATIKSNSPTMGLDSINPNQIKSINVLKGPSAIAKYGEQAKYGVIEIFTKKNNDTIPERINSDNNKIFEKVEIEASFPGGVPEWKKYLQINFDQNIPVKNNAPKGDYTVIVQFIVDTAGYVSDIKALTKHGYGMEEEAMKMIKLGPPWIPAIQNGHKVKAYRKQPITFYVNNNIKKTNFIESSSDENADGYPLFPGGQPAWKDFIEENINTKFFALKNDPNVSLTWIEFDVNEDGSLSNFAPLTKGGLGKEEEAIRLLKLSRKWIPGTKNGKKTKYKWAQAFSFSIASVNSSHGTWVLGKPEFTKSMGETSSEGANSEGNKIYPKVQIEPSFPGGHDAWEKFLQKNLNGSVGADNGASEGTYTIWVQFLVDKDGNYSDVKALTHFGYGFEEEVIRTIRLSPKWIPAMQNGHKVTAYKKQAITFVISDGDNEKNAAIRRLEEIVEVAYISSKTENELSSSKKIDLLPEVQIGSIEWKRYFERWINPFVPVSEGWGEGSYTLLFQFARNTNGSVEEIKCLDTDHRSSKTAEMCINLFKNINVVKLAKEDKGNSKKYYIQPLTFVIMK